MKRLRFEQSRNFLRLIILLLSITSAESQAEPSNVTSSAELRRSDSAIELIVRVAGHVEHSSKRVRAVLLDFDRFGHWFPTLGEWRVLARGANSALVYGRQRLPWPWKDRDYYCRYIWHEQKTGSFTLEATAIDAPSGMAYDGPESIGALRIRRMTTSWTLSPTDSGTQITYEYRGDPKMKIPRSALEFSWERHTRRLIEALDQEVERSQTVAPIRSSPKSRRLPMAIP